MSRTFIRPSTQIRKSDAYVGTLTPGSALESASTSLEDDLNALRSMTSLLLDNQSGNWYDDLLTPATFENGAKRGIQTVNQDLHDLERKRVLVDVFNLNDVVVLPGENVAVLDNNDVLPSGGVLAVGVVTTLGAVVAAHGGTFGQHSLAVVAGANTLSPKNLVPIVDSVSHDPFLSDNRVVWGLLHSESGIDGSTASTTTPDRVQISFVRQNAAGNDLEAVPVADIENKTIHYSARVRKALSDLNEQDFLKGAHVDTPAATVVTRQYAYDNQGTTPVEITDPAFLDLNATAIKWTIRDKANAELFTVLEGSDAGASEVQVKSDVDTFSVGAALNTFAHGVRVDVSGERISVGESAGLIEAVGVAGLRLFASAGDTLLDDSHRAGSGFDGTTGLRLSASTQEWSDFETAFGGEVSLLKALTDARNSGSDSKTYAVVNTLVNANADVSVDDANIDVALPNMAGGDFLKDYDVFLNGTLLRPGADAAANHDYYPGTTATSLRFEFPLHENDVICVAKKIA
jgi:hypothetical protein